MWKCSIRKTGIRTKLKFQFGRKHQVGKPGPSESSGLMGESRTPYFMQMNRVKEMVYSIFSEVGQKLKLQ